MFNIAKASNIFNTTYSLNIIYNIIPVQRPVVQQFAILVLYNALQIAGIIVAKDPVHCSGQHTRAGTPGLLGCSCGPATSDCSTVENCEATCPGFCCSVQPMVGIIVVPIKHIVTVNILAVQIRGY